MNIHVLQENLLKSLTRITRVVPTRPQLPILQNLKLVASEEGLEITATNMETTETIWVGSKVEKSGEVCVSARVLTELVASLPPETVHLIIKEEALHVSCGKFTAELPTVGAAEFPPKPELLSKDVAKIDKEKFCSTLSGVLFAAATDEGRPVLTGVRVVEEGEKTLFVATDGYRLSLRRVVLPVKSLSGVIIPAKALIEVVKLSNEDKEEKEIKVGLAGEHQAGFVVGDTTLLTRLIDGEYPSFERIIPKTFTTRALIEKEPFLQAVRSAAIFARDNANIIRLNLDKQRVVVSANAAQTGKNAIELGAKIDGDGGEIAFNSRFLLDFLSSFPDEEFLFEMTGSLNSGVFRPVKDDDALHIIMPVRVSGSE
ncbi:DNA polymerase III subunit beta [Candidatus Gottesmanbacteria bacterium]|nr:DNA polymerase III subunit beta [Candidatus Gottesmanbacteria bacterium]